MATPYGYQDTTDPRKLASNQRTLIQQRGDELNQADKDQAAEAGRNYYNYTDQLDPIEQQMARGEGGYNAQETQDIMGTQGLQGLLNPNANYLTPGEQAGITGDTGSYTRYFDPDSMTTAQDTSAGMQRQAVDNLQQGLNNAIDPNALQQSKDYQAQTAGQLKGNQAQFNNVLNSYAGNVRGAIDPSAVTASQQFLNDYRMTPEEQQNIVTGAGISAGTGYRAAIGDAERQARAAGSNPMGVAALRNRLDRQAAADAGDAMTQARIAASNAAAQRELTGEQLREQGGQYLTNVKTGTEMGLGQQALQGQQALGEQALNQANLQEQNRQQSQQYLTGANLNAAATGGEAALQNEANINAQQRQQQQYNATTGTGIAQAQDTANSNRAAYLGTNRQNTNATNFNQGFNVNNATSQRAQTVGNARLGQQNTGLQAQEGRATTQNQNQQNAYNRQQQNYATQSGAGNQATGMGIQASQTPSTFDKVVGGITGGIGAAASFLDDGGIAVKPTLAVVGEHGPEVIVPASGRTVPMRPDPRRRKSYGEAA